MSGSPDERWIYFTPAVQEGDLWLAELEWLPLHASVSESILHGRGAAVMTAAVGEGNAVGTSFRVTSVAVTRASQPAANSDGTTAQ